MVEETQEIVENIDNLVNESIVNNENTNQDDLQLGITKTKPRRSAQERIDEAIWQREEVKRELEKSRLRIAELERPKPPDKVASIGAPDPEQYAAGKYDPEYLEALTDYKVNLRFEAQERQLKEKEQLKAISQLEDQAADTHPDYSKAKTRFLSHDLANVGAFMELVRESESPVELTYFLGKNPGELDKIGEMTPAQAARYLGRLEAQLTPPQESGNKPGTSAPKPITPLTGGKTAFVKDPEKMSMEEYAAYRKSLKN